MHDAEEVVSSMDEQTARTILRSAVGWIRWNDVGDCPGWHLGQIVLDGRFTMDEPRAILVMARTS